MQKIGMLLVMTVCLTMLQASAQKKYLVYAIKGKPEVMESKQAKPLLTGTVLTIENSISLLKGDAVYILGEKDFCVLKLTKPGVFQLKLLQQSCINQPQNITYNYFKYVWESFTHPHEKPAQNRKAFMKNYGAAIRGCEYIQPINFEDTIRYGGKSSVLQWRNTEPFNTSYLVVYDKPKGGNIVVDTSITGSEINLQQLTARLQKGKTYYFTIAAEKGTSCNRFVLAYMTNKKVTAFVQSATKQLQQQGFSGEGLKDGLSFIAEEQKYFGVQ